jgi:hypothetical protein
MLLPGPHVLLGRLALAIGWLVVAGLAGAYLLIKGSLLILLWGATGLEEMRPVQCEFCGRRRSA